MSTKTAGQTTPVHTGPSLEETRPLAGVALPIEDARTTCEPFQANVERLGDGVAVRTRDGEVSITWREYGARVRALAGGLAGLGIAGGDTLAIMLANRPEFFLADTAAQHLGATPFSVYNTSSPEQISYLLADAESRVVVTELAFLDTVRAAMALGGVVEHVVVVDGSADGTMTLDDLVAAAHEDFDFEATWRAVEPSDVATLIYTSGTTGPPKGVELTHANLVVQWNMLVRVWPIGLDGRVISYLPSAHIADRTIGIYCVNMLGHTVTCCPDARELGATLPDARPTLFLGVPRIYEKLKAGIEAGVGRDPDPDRRRAFAGALQAALRRVRAEQGGPPLDVEERAAAERAEADVFAPLRAKLGLDRVECFLVGAAPTPMDVHEFFHAAGMPLAEVWGMSELSPVATWNPPQRIRLGTVGPPMPGVEVMLAEDGEVLVRGPLVMRGYRNEPEKTAETIDRDGWLHSGDIGAWDEAGYLSIVDRKKELIINAAGKNMSPANIEAELKSAAALIGQACVIGDARPYNVALLTLDPDAVPVFAAANGLDASDLGAFSRADSVLKAIAEGVERANAKLSRVEQVKRWTLLPDEWLPAGDELTPTMKLKRRPISAKYAARIEALYER